MEKHWHEYIEKMILGSINTENMPIIEYSQLSCNTAKKFIELYDQDYEIQTILSGQVIFDNRELPDDVYVKKARDVYYDYSNFFKEDKYNSPNSQQLNKYDDNICNRTVIIHRKLHILFKINKDGDLNNGKVANMEKEPEIPEEEKEAEFAGLDKSMMCSICMERKINTVILDCKMSVLCVTCSRQLMKQKETQKCPICRKSIKKGIIRIYN